MKTQLEAATKKVEQMRRDDLYLAWSFLGITAFLVVCVVLSVIEKHEVAPFVFGFFAYCFSVATIGSFQSARDIGNNPEHRIYTILAEYRNDEVKQ